VFAFFVWLQFVRINHMKLLITGGAGFIGGNFVHYWHKTHPEDTLVVLDKLTYAGNLATLESVKNAITFIEGDICDENIVEEAMSGVDCVVHFAAESHVDRSIHDPYIFTHSNALGTHVLLETARKLKISRFHHISTDEVFGDIPLEETWKFIETTPYKPSSPYSASKAASDHLVRAYFHTFGLPITISNCSNNFGPFHYPEKFIPRSIIRLMNGENIRLYTPGNQVRDWLHVTDHCRAIELILQKGTIGETYCIGGLANGISNIEVAKKLLKIMDLPEERIELVTDRPGHDVKYDIDWSKINKGLGWQPLHSFDEWLTQTVDWYKTNQAWWEPLVEESENFYKTKGEQVIQK
jgi:dTDP-glucose 4,6-dehydratase